MAYFPRVGTELSSESVLRFLVPGTTHNRPAIIQRYEDGSRSARFRTPAGTIDFTIDFTGPEADVAVLVDFFEEYGVVNPFTVEHPTRGTMTRCYLKQQAHPVEPFVNAELPWSHIVIPIEGAP
jgi:hypothetical protein